MDSSTLGAEPFLKYEPSGKDEELLSGQQAVAIMTSFL